MRLVFYVALFLLLTDFTSKPKNLFMIGDSTMANKEEKAKPETGWGEVLQAFFDSSKITVSNHARNGRSSKSFRNEGLWQPVYDNIKKGDYVIIQFGHNDEKDDSARHTDPNTTYRANLIRYIKETKEKGGIPILCTPIVRRKFNDQGHLTETHGNYPDAARKVARDQRVTLIDLEHLTREMITNLGPDESKKLFLYTEPGQYANRPDGVKDDTHLNNEGALKVAGLAVESLKKQRQPLAKFLL